MKKNYGYYIDLVENFDNLSQIEQVKYISYFYTIINESDKFTSTVIGDVFDSENLRRPPNVTDCLNKLTTRTPSILLKKGNVYSFQRSSKKSLDEMYLDKKHVQAISETLRDLLGKVKSKEQKVFLEEAIICYEVKAYRASIVMTWLLTMDIMYEHVINNKLAAFNTAMSKNGKFAGTSIAKKEDFSKMQESEFITFLISGNIITKDQRKILDEKLGTRNTAAHPNTIEVKESKATNVIEDLVLNIISQYQ